MFEVGHEDFRSDPSPESPEEREQRLGAIAEEILAEREKSLLDRGRWSYYQYTGNKERLESEGGEGAYSNRQILKKDPPRHIVEIVRGGGGVEAHKPPEGPNDYFAAWEEYTGKLQLGKEYHPLTPDELRTKFGDYPLVRMPEGQRESIKIADLPKEVALKFARRMHTALAGDNPALECFADAKRALVGFAEGALEAYDADTVVGAYTRLKKTGLLVEHMLEKNRVPKEERGYELRVLLDAIDGKIFEAHMQKSPVAATFAEKLKTNIPEIAEKK